MPSYLIIGGSSGIGLETTRLLTTNGATVYAASRHQSDELTKTGATYLNWDATGDEPLSGFPDQLDGLVYCPGSINLKPFHRLTLEDFMADMHLNYMGAIRAVQAALPALKQQGGSVVLFSTVAVQTGMPFHSSIAGAKGAVEGLTRALAAEYAASNIRVNAIAPSLTDTPLAERLLATEDKRTASAKRHPLNKIGTPQEMAQLVHFLLSDSAAWMTGQIIHLDGGLGALRSI